MSAARASGARERTASGRRVPLEFRILGSFEVRRANDPIRIGGSRPRALLALLLIHGGRPVSVDRIVDVLWGEQPAPTARHMVEVYVSNLRKVLGAERIVRDPVGYVLRLDGEECDATRFERLFAEGREALASGESDLASARLGEGLALWRGPPLSDFAFEPFAEAESARLAELRLLAEEERIEAELTRGDTTEVLGELEELVAREPLRERRRAQLMLALYRAGRQAHALAVYRETRRVLRDELALEPSPDLRRLERDILAQDPALAFPVAPTAEAPAAEERRLVAVAFAELCGDDGSDPEVARARRERMLSVATEALTRHGASVERLPDETLMAVFGLPRAHEDDALRAARAAKEAHACLAAHHFVSGLRLRIGIEASEAITGPGRHISGPVVRRAARLKEAAVPGQTVVGEGIRKQLGDSAEVEPVSGSVAEPQAWRLRNVHPSLSLPPRQGPFVGRRAELDSLREAFSGAVHEGRAFLVTVVGEPGVGKSRLAEELTSLLAREARIVVGRCPAYGEGITYWPLRELIRSVAGGDDRSALKTLLGGEVDGEAVVERLASALGEDGRRYPVDEIRWAGRRLFEALARDRPLIAVIDDAHWAEQTFLELLEHAASRSRGGPALIVCLARPELFEDHSGFAADAYLALELARLGELESKELVDLLDTRNALTPDEREHLITRAEGNPLFLEHLVLFAAEAGDRGQQPQTLEALLAARLGRLAPGERVVAQCAAIVGRDFAAAAVAELLPPEARRTLPRQLDALARRALIAREPSPLPFEQAYSFRHVLIQEAAYRLVLKEKRAELHERLARFLEQAPAFTAGDLDELVGYHLEQTYGYLRELGTSDGRKLEIAREAGERLARGGLRAFDRADMPAAAGLLRRSAMLFAPRTPDRVETLIQLSDAMRLRGDLGGEKTVLAEAAGEARALGDPALDAILQMKTVAARFFSNPKETNEELAAVCQRVIPLLEELEDDRGLARALRHLCSIEHTASRWSNVERFAERALSHARRCGDRVSADDCLEYLAYAVTHGAASVTKGLQRLSEIRSEAGDDRRLDAMAATLAAYLEAMACRFPVARDLVATAQETFEERSQLFANAWLAAYAGDIELLADDPFAAEQHFRRSYWILQEMGERANRAELAARLADVLCTQRRLDEAEAFTRVAEELAASDDALTQVKWRRARARVFAQRPAAEEAEQLTREALRLSRQTDDIVLQAGACIDLATTIRTRDPTEATARLREAVNLYRRKGHRVGGAKARRLLAELGDV
jgi:DNA-binding SARP family transcriptional activator